MDLDAIRQITVHTLTQTIKVLGKGRLTKSYLVLINKYE